METLEPGTAQVTDYLRDMIIVLADIRAELRAIRDIVEAEADRS